MTNENLSFKKKLDDDYYLDTDAHQYILQRRTIVQKGKNKGEESYTNIAFQGSLEEIINSYLKVKLREGVGRCKEVKEILPLIKELKDEVKDLLKGV